MKDIEHASINGVEIHNLAEQDSDENLLYSGELWLEGKPVGSFRELNEDEMQLDIAPEFEQTMNERIASYLQALTEDEEGEGGAVNEGELSSEIFFEDLIELELYLQAFKDGVTEGYGCLPTRAWTSSAWRTRTRWKTSPARTTSPTSRPFTSPNTSSSTVKPRIGKKIPARRKFLSSGAGIFSFRRGRFSAAFFLGRPDASRRRARFHTAAEIGLAAVAFESVGHGRSPPSHEDFSLALRRIL